MKDRRIRLIDPADQFTEKFMAAMDYWSEFFAVIAITGAVILLIVLPVLRRMG